MVDGTPQERSEDVMQCGPTSVQSIKEGEVYFPYDTKFVLSEVASYFLQRDLPLVSS